MKFCYVLSTKKKWKKNYVLSDCPSLYSNCSQLGGGVSRDVSTDHKETANQDILLGQKFQSRQIVGAESCKVCHHNGENEGKAAAINASDVERNYQITKSVVSALLSYTNHTNIH